MPINPHESVPEHDDERKHRVNLNKNVIIQLELYLPKIDADVDMNLEQKREVKNRIVQLSGKLCEVLDADGDLTLNAAE